MARWFFTGTPRRAAEPPCDLTEVASGAGDVQGIAATANLVYRGFTIKEDAAGVAVVTLHHGTDATGPLLGAASLAADGATTVTSPPIRCPDGIFVNRVSGTTTLGLLTRVETG